MSQRQQLREVFTKHADKVIELRELAEHLADAVGRGKLALMPDFKIHELPLLFLKAAEIKAAQKRLIAQTPLQENLRAAVGDGTLGVYYDREVFSSFTDWDGKETITSHGLVDPEEARTEYIRLAQQVHFLDTPPLRPLAFDRLSLTALTLLPKIPKDRLITALDAALTKCEDHSARVTAGTIIPVPLKKAFFG